MSRFRGARGAALLVSTGMLGGGVVKPEIYTVCPAITPILGAELLTEFRGKKGRTPMGNVPR